MEAIEKDELVERLKIKINNLECGYKRLEAENAELRESKGALLDLCNDFDTNHLPTTNLLETGSKSVVHNKDAAAAQKENAGLKEQIKIMRREHESAMKMRY